MSRLVDFYAFQADRFSPRGRQDFLPGATDSDALLWKAAVVAAGGTVSDARLSLVSTLIGSLKTNGVWPNMADCWPLAGENQTQSTISLKKRVACVLIGTPLFATNRGVIFNGSSNGLDTGFKPNANAPLANASSELSVYMMSNETNSSGFAAGVQTDGNGTLRINPNTGNAGSGAACTVNSTSFTGPNVTESRGLVSAYRNGSTCGVYYNGADLTGITQPGTLGNSQSSQNLYIGCSNNAGTAAAFRTCTIGWVSAKSFLTPAQELAEFNAVNSWLAAQGAFNVYLSADAFGGMPQGDDSTGLGSSAAPWRTLDKALANLPFGGTVLLNGNPVSPSVYQSANASGCQLTTGANFQAINPLGAAIAGNNATTTALIGKADAVFNFNGIVFNPLLGAVHATTVMNFAITATPYTVNFNQCLFTGWGLGYAGTPNGATLRAFLNYNQCNFTADSVSGGLLLQTFDQGGITINGGSTVITNQKTVSVGGHVIQYTNTGLTPPSILNHDVSVTLDPALAGGGVHYGIHLFDTPGAIVDGGTHRMLSAASARGCTNVAISQVTLGIDGAVIRNLFVQNTAPSGIFCLIGNDSLSDKTKANNNVVTNIKQVGVSSLNIEAVVFGSTTDGLATLCEFTGVQDIGTKDSLRFRTLRNKMTDSTGLSLVSRGSTGTVFDGDILTQTTNGPDSMVSIGTGDAGTGDVGCVWQNIQFIVNGDVGSLFVNVNAASTIGVPNHNTYTVLSGTMGTNPWRTPTLYASPGASSYGPAVEPTATFVNC